MPELTSAWANSAATRMPFMIGLLVRGAVADDADAADAEQRGAAVLGVVEALLEVVEGLAREQRADLRGDGGLERLAQQDADQLGGAFAWS